MDKKLNVKDLINVGIFTVIYFFMFFISGTLGYFPIFAILLPLLLGILTGIPFILFISKVGKFGMVTIMGVLLGIVCFLMGQWIAIIFGSVCGLIADLILRAGDYKDWKKTVLGFCVFNEWIIGTMLPIWILGRAYFEQNGAPTEEYIENVLILTAKWMFPVEIALGVVGALIGAYIGRMTLKKHFRRAGII